MAQKGKTTKDIGNLGEEIACRYLKEKGFLIIERNYWKKWGEIDIVAKRRNVIHFVEVKTVSRENGLGHEGTSNYRPEENVHPKKLERMRRVIQSYILQKQIEGGTWQFDVLAVFLDAKQNIARCRMLENIIL